MAGDPQCKVACETATKDNRVMVAREITTKTKIDYKKVVRGVRAKIVFDSYVDDLTSVDSRVLATTRARYREAERPQNLGRRAAGSGTSS